MFPRRVIKIDNNTTTAPNKISVSRGGGGMIGPRRVPRRVPVDLQHSSAPTPSSSGTVVVHTTTHDQVDRRSKLDEWRASKKAGSSQQQRQVRRTTMVSSKGGDFGLPPPLPPRKKAKLSAPPVQPPAESTVRFRGNIPVGPGRFSVAMATGDRDEPQFTAKPVPTATHHTSATRRRSALSGRLRRSAAPSVDNRPASGQRREVAMVTGATVSHDVDVKLKPRRSVLTSRNHPVDNSAATIPTGRSNKPQRRSVATAFPNFDKFRALDPGRDAVGRGRSLHRLTIAPLIPDKPTATSKIPIARSNIPLPDKNKRHSVAAAAVPNFDKTRHLDPGRDAGGRGRSLHRRTIAPLIPDKPTVASTLRSNIPQPDTRRSLAGGATAPPRPRRSLAPGIPDRPTLSSQLKARRSVAPSTGGVRNSLAAGAKRPAVIEEEEENAENGVTPSLRNKLTSWLTSKGKTPSKFHRLVNLTTPSKKRKFSDLEEFQNEMLKQSWKKALEKEDKEEKEKRVAAIVDLLDECSRLVNTDYDDTELWLNRIQTTYPDCVSITQYWLVRAASAAASEGQSASLAVFRDAQQYNPQPRALFWNTYRSFLAQPIQPSPNEDREGNPTAGESDSASDNNALPPDVFQTPVAKMTRSRVGPIDTASPGVAACVDEGEKTPMYRTPLQTPSRLNDKRPPLTPDTATQTPSSIVKYKITPYRSVQFNDSVLAIPTTMIVTPVRRSGRLSNIQHKLPREFQEKEDCFTSLDLVGGKENVKFLQPIYELLD